MGKLRSFTTIPATLPSRSCVRTEGVSVDETDADTEGDSGDDQDSDDSSHDDFPESIVDIELGSMVSLGPLNPAGVLLRSGQLNEFNTPGGGQDEVQPKQY